MRLRSDRYLSLDDERSKALRLDRIAESTDLEGVARAYYAMTPDVDPKRCSGFLRHILRSEGRGEALAKSLGGEGPILEVGCGTGGLLAAASRRGLAIEGVDIAARWLVVARRRLKDLGVSVPLVAASADRLPYDDGAFQTVVADSLIEHCDDPSASLREWRRVLRPGGRLILWSPNRRSITPDPHVRLWGVGFLRRSLAVRYIRWRRGGAWLPPCLTLGEAVKAVMASGLQIRSVGTPDLGPEIGRAGAIYRRIRSTRGTTRLLESFGPVWSLEAVR